MRLSEARAIIEAGKQAAQQEPKGYMIHFEESEPPFLTGRWFPDKHAGEQLLPDEQTAWQLAEEFAAYAPAKYVRIYVVDSHFVPVPTYKEKMLRQAY